MQISRSTPAVVTGAASGLGAAVATALADAGAPVAVFDVDADRGAALAKSLDGKFCKVNVGDADAVRTGFDEARAAHGQERIVVNCAGIGTPGKVAAIGAPLDSAVFHNIITVNLIGTFHTSARAAAGMMAADPLNADNERGVIINTSSIAAFEGQTGQLAYAASKAGVAGMTLPMARDLAGDGIRVVTLAPGTFDTPMLAGVPDSVRASLGKQVPFPSRLGDPREFAALALHVISNPMLNGEVIRLDGALRMGMR